MKNRQSHLHREKPDEKPRRAKHTYFGEFDASPVIDWLNSPGRSAADPIEKLVDLSAGLPIESSEDDLRSLLASVISRWKVAVAPVLAGATPAKWDVGWRLVGKMPPAPALALVRLLHLADKGLLGRIRKCERKDCGRWFYARFEHQRFHSGECQQRTFQEDPEWKRRRAEHMRELRHAEKLREQRGRKR